MMPKLLIKKDNLLVRKLLVPEDLLAFTVGSELGNDVIIEDDRVSVFHLQFEKQEDEYFVRDLQSHSGTFVNGKRITTRTHIKNNDEIGLGYSTIIFLNPKSNSRTSLLTPGHELEKSFSEQTIEDRIAGVPTLKRLNSWLHDEPESYERKGDFFIENDENGGLHPPPVFAPDQLLESEKIESEKPLIPKSDVESGDIVDNVTEKKTKKSESKYYLLGIYGPYQGTKFKLTLPVTRIGRDRKLNDIVIRKNSKGKIDQTVSRRHASITCKNDSFYVTDKRSKTRTFVNTKKLAVNDEVLIQPGDELEIVSGDQSHIFRLVRTGDWDFSFPKKAGPWHIKYRMAVLNTASVALILVSAFFFTTSLNTINLISKKPKPLAVKEEIWFADENNARFNGSVNPSNLPYGAAVADINGDDFVDLIYIDGKGYLKSVNGKTRELLWSNNDFQASPLTPITLEDLNNNGIPDIIVVSYDLRIRAIDGKWGIEIWKSPILAGPLNGPPVVADFNGDGAKDIAITSLENAVYIGFPSLKNSRWIRLDCEEPVRSIPSAEDFTGDRIPNILLGTETGKIIVIDGAQQKFLGELNINEELNKATGMFDQDNQIRYPVAFGDLNGDKITDLTIITLQGNTIALNGKTLERFWYDASEPNPDLNQIGNQAVALGDLDGDQQLDVVILTSTGKLRALKGTGEGKDRKIVLWEHSITNSGIFVEAPPVLADFNKNKTMDVVTYDSDGRIYIFEGSTGEILWQNSQGGSTFLASPFVGDFDNDDYLDILALKSDGNFYKLSTNRLITGNTVVWGQIFGNSRHTNASLYREPNVSSYYSVIGIAITLLLVVIASNVYFRKNRRDLRSR
jgi:pSer/pThr/pTyr-binding forkhead associated (FHA) protein/outer membrane protein assembly factor BamB